MLYQIAMDQKKADKAIAIIDKYIDSRPKDSEGYLMKGQALLLKKDFYGTVEMASEGIKVNPLESRCYLLGAQAFQGLKDETQMRAWYNAGMLRNAKTANEQQSSMESMNAIYESITGEPIDFEKYFGRWFEGGSWKFKRIESQLKINNICTFRKYYKEYLLHTLSVYLH